MAKETKKVEEKKIEKIKEQIDKLCIKKRWLKKEKEVKHLINLNLQVMIQLREEQVLESLVLVNI